MQASCSRVDQLRQSLDVRGPELGKLPVLEDQVEDGVLSFQPFQDSGSRGVVPRFCLAQPTGWQSQGIEQVTQALTQIDQVTQSNTANAEESASASEELSGQAAQLKQMISKIQTDKRKNSRIYRTGG